MLLNADVSKIASMIEADPSMADKIGVTSSLQQKTGGVHSGAWLYAITSQAKEPTLAWEFITLILSEERCRARMELVSMVPPIDSLRAEYIALNPIVNEAQLENLTFSTAWPKASCSSVLESALHLAYDEIVYDVSTPEEALANAEQEVEKNR